MAKDTLTLDIVTPAGPVEGGAGIETPGVEVPGATGEMGILPEHVPIVSPLRAGVVRFRHGDESHRIAVGPGFVEVAQGGDVVVLASRAAVGVDIDAKAVESELTDLKAEIGGLGSDEDGKRAHLEAEREWLEAQLRAATN